jgi:DNA-binding transcriptional MerR regulator
MAFTVGELAKLTGVTVRTLHHYDELGLVRPSQRTAAGYRLYDDADVLRLHEVLLFRELGLPLDEIAKAIESAKNRDDVLRRHREVLHQKRARLDAMIAAVEQRLTNTTGEAMSAEDVKQLFDGFDPSQYEEEVKQRWGETDAYKESARRTRGYKKEDWARYQQEAKAIDDELIALMRAGKPVTDAAVQAGVEKHRLLIDRWFYPCSVEMHRSLGAMYVADPRFAANLDANAPGYAQFLSEAITSGRS